MKILILFCVCTLCFSNEHNQENYNIFVNVTGLQGKRFISKFETQQEADKWISGNVANDSWGKEGTYSILVCDTELTYPEGRECNPIVKDIKDKKDKKEADKIKEATLVDKYKKMKLDELIELLRIKGVI